MKPTSIRIDETTLHRLDALARTMGQSRGQVISEALDRFIEYHEWFLASVDEGIKAADEGDVATDEETRDAFRKWGVRIG